MGFFDRLREGLSKTTQQIVQRFDELVSQSEAPERRAGRSTSTRSTRSKSC